MNDSKRKNNIKTHVFNRNRYNILFVPQSKLGKETDGLCDPPDAYEKTIRINSDLSPKRELIATIHEATHANFFFLDEESVNQASEDLGNFLWRLGYRKIDKKEEE